jgi:hypothetical protein
MKGGYKNEGKGFKGSYYGYRNPGGNGRKADKGLQE